MHKLSKLILYGVISARSPLPIILGRRRLYSWLLFIKCGMGIFATWEILVGKLKCFRIGNELNPLESEWFELMQNGGNSI